MILPQSKHQNVSQSHENTLVGGESKATLFLVATPIGNAGDITLRALEILKSVDVIACEDTRTTKPLMNRYGIHTPLLSYHEHNAARMRPVLLKKLQEGQRIALVSDAGTPLISDPGYKLVQMCIENHISVTAVPGASAVLTALVLSGLPSDQFLFGGFLPPKTAGRRKSLQKLAAIPATLIFFESAQRLPKSLEDMAGVLGSRPAAVARELTKLFEEVRRGSLSELEAHYKEHGPPKGEVVVVIGPPLTQAPPSGESLDELLHQALDRLSVRDAAAEVAEMSNLPRKHVYARALELMKTRKEDKI